jgi:hypothetical protein
MVLLSIGSDGGGGGFPLVVLPIEINPIHWTRLSPPCAPPVPPRKTREGGWGAVAAPAGSRQTRYSQSIPLCGRLFSWWGSG